MKKFAILNLLILLVLNSFAQLFKADQHGIELFQAGSRLIELGEYKKADSVLTLALNTYKHENVYFNRAMSRLYLRDTIGFCSDMNIAANKFFDNGAESYLNKYCCRKVDTFYYDGKLKPASKLSFKYYEVYQEFKYENDRIGKIHDIKEKNFLPVVTFGSNSDLLDLTGRETDIIGIYTYIDSVKYYTLAGKQPTIENWTKYNEAKKKGSAFLGAKYQTLKETNKIIKILVRYTINLSNKGNVVSVKFEGTNPEIDLKDKLKEFEADIASIVKYYPKINPVKFINQNVNIIISDFLEF